MVESIMEMHPEGGSLLNKIKNFLILLFIFSLLSIASSGCKSVKRKKNKPGVVIKAFFSSIKEGSISTALEYWSVRDRKQKKFYRSLINKWAKEKKLFKIKETAYYNENRFDDFDKVKNKNTMMVAYNVSNSEIFALNKKQGEWRITAYLNVQGGFKKIFNTSPERAREYQDFVSGVVSFIKNSRPEKSYKVVNKKLITFQQFKKYSAQIKKIEFKSIYFIGSPSDYPNDGKLANIGNFDQKVGIFFSDHKINKIVFQK